MATFKIRFEGDKPGRTRAELNKVLREMARRNEELIRLVEKPGVYRAMLNAGQVIQARAQEILTEKGHVVTGTLRRSINTQVFPPGQSPAEAGGETSCERKLARVRGAVPSSPSPSSIVTQVGSFVVYAPCVEALPDGGFLFEASEEAFPLAAKIIAEQGVAPELVAWAKVGGRGG